MMCHMRVILYQLLAGRVFIIRSSECSHEQCHLACVCTVTVCRCGTVLMFAGKREVNCLRKSSLQDDLFSRQLLIHTIN